MGILEIIVETIEDAMAAANGGATQLDLKSHYPCSGITPSPGIVARVLEKISIPVMVMIRPHARWFTPSQDDILTACEEIRQFRKIGVNHFLTGFITLNNSWHKDAIKAMRDAAGDCELHAHLAWELANEPEQTIEDMISCGISSMRTSGKTSNSAYGGEVSNAIKRINHYKKIVDNRIDILLAGGINPENVADIILQTGITNIHCGRGVRIPPKPESPVIELEVCKLKDSQDFAVEKLNKMNKNNSKTEE